MQANVSNNRSLVVVSRTPKAKANKVVRTSTVVTVSRRRRRRRVQTIPRNIGSGMDAQYMRCLSDPFNCPPVRAGFGCLVQTELHTAYIRTALTSNSDGSINFFVVPNPNNLLLFNNSGLTNGATTGTAGLLAAANSSVLNGLYNSSRTLAMGIRLIPMIAGTSVPGIIAMGCAPRCALADAVASTTTTPINPATNSLFNRSSGNILALPYLREHMARPGGVDYFQVTWRPTDSKDFQFQDTDAANIFLSGGTTVQPFYNSLVAQSAPMELDTQGSFLVISANSLPASTVFAIEVVLHLECINSNGGIGSVDGFDNSPSVADKSDFVSMESLYRGIRGYLPSVETVAGAATSLLQSPMVQAAGRQYLNRMLGVRTTGYELL